MSSETREKIRQKKSKLVAQYDLNGNLLNIYNSITEASILTNTDLTSICCCCKGKYKKANNYIWKYVNKSNRKETE